MKKRYMLSEKLVQRVNELHYDLTNEQYHPHEILEREKDRWERIAKQFINFTYPVTILDIGTGAGFVPLTIAKFLEKEDVFICSDISRGILEIAKQKIEKQNFRCKFKFVKIESQVPLRLPFGTNTADIITMNSVLHHIKETNAFLKEVDRVLKLGGLFVISHEPNEYFYAHKFLWYNYLILSLIFNPERVVIMIGRKTHTIDTLWRVYYYLNRSQTPYYGIQQKINRMLLKEKIISNPLSIDEIFRILDIKSGEGFKPDLLLPNYNISYIETYNHLFWVTIKHYNNGLVRRYDNWLKKKFPKFGATFLIILKKLKNKSPCHRYA